RCYRDWSSDVCSSDLKAFRARATVELGNFLGWDNAHNVIYAGALDVAVGPRWYSTYEMACNIVKIFVEKQAVSAIPYGGASPEEIGRASCRERERGAG